MTDFGKQETKGSVAEALSAWQSAYSRLQRVWGTVTCTETYDPSFVAAKRECTRLGSIYRVKLEALAVGQVLSAGVEATVDDVHGSCLREFFQSRVAFIRPA